MSGEEESTEKCGGRYEGREGPERVGQKRVENLLEVRRGKARQGKAGSNIEAKSSV
jgi:hypothetical protein